MEQREKLIKEGLVKPVAPPEIGDRNSRDDQSTSAQRQAQLNRNIEQVEFVARQLYNVIRGELARVAPEAPEVLLEYSQLDDEMRHVIQAQARYVLSTFADNHRLRKRVKELEGKLGVLATEA